MNDKNPFSDNHEDKRQENHFSEYDMIGNVSSEDKNKSNNSEKESYSSGNDDFTPDAPQSFTGEFSSQGQQVPPSEWQQPQQTQWTFNDYANSNNQPKKSKKPKKEKTSTNKGLKIFAIAISSVFVITLGLFVAYVVYTSTNDNGGSGINGSNSSQQNGEAPSLSVDDIPKDNQPDKDATGRMTTQAVAKEVKPSVVGIIAYVKQGTYKVASQGSGIIMSADGYIITNAHVVTSQSAQMPIEKVEVVLSNGETHVAKVIGKDTKTDIAILKINQNNLTAAKFGDSNKLEDGETVIAIGNPSGLQLAGSVTQGIVSSAKRIMIFESSEPMEYIQTDAAINPGNSGGALVNQFGQVVGINTAKISATDYEGIGFAIPISYAKPIIDSIIQNGYVKGRVRIGITYQPISETLAQLNGIPQGLRVVEVDETCDVAKQGVRKGDIITKIDDTTVVDTDTIKTALDGKKPGDKITLSIYRIDETGKANNIQIKVMLEEDVPVQ